MNELVNPQDYCSNLNIADNEKKADETNLSSVSGLVHDRDRI